MKGKLMRRVRGFTLIELMIVVAIIAILATLAMPVYQEYVVRSQVTEAAALASGARTAVSEEYANTGTFVGITNSTAGLAVAASITGRYVESVTAAGGVVAVLMGNDASDKISGSALDFSPVDRDGSIEWVCKAGTPAMEGKYLPSSCR